MMSRRTILTLSACTALTVLSYGSLIHVRAAGPQTPSEVGAPDPIYAHVSHLGWVVRDVDATAAAWRALGVTNIRDGGVQELPGVAYRGTTVTARVKTAFASFSNGMVEWIQPLNEGTEYAHFLARHGEGVQHVAFSVPTDARLTGELARYQALGVGVLQSGIWRSGAGTGRFADLDTASEGGGMTL